MNSINLVKHNFKLSTRNYTLSTNNNFKIPSIGLIQSFKIQNFDSLIEKYKNIKLVLTIGNFQIETSDLYNSEIKDTISIKELRNYIRNIDFPETDFDNKLLNFEHFLFSQQLKCTEHYYTLNNKDLQDSIFTSGINLYIEAKLNNVENSFEKCKDLESSSQILDDILIEETYWEKVYDDNKK